MFIFRVMARSKARPGSSMVEMLVAIVVLMFVLMAMGSMLLLSRTALYTKEDETAKSIALRYIEELEAMPFDDFADAALFADPVKFSNKYDATVSVVSKDDYSATIRVSVRWSPASGGAKNVNLERIISAGGHKNVGKL
jgi:Tfp pilus assembly protein PilV